MGWVGAMGTGVWFLMEIERIDDYQSWRIHGAGHRLLIDPWLVDDLEVGRDGRWLRRQHGEPVRLRPREVLPPDVIVLTSALQDHAHRPTLAALDRSLRVIGSPGAVALARRLGFKSTIALGAGSRIVLDERLALTAIRPRFPYSAISIGILVESLETGVRIYLEPHLAPERHPLLESGVDVLITPVERVRMFGVNLAMTLEECTELARRLRARWVFATGSNPGSAKGLLPERLWRIESSMEAFESVIQLHVGEGRGRQLASGERLSIPPRRRRSA